MATVNEDILYQSGWPAFHVEEVNCITFLLEKREKEREVGEEGEDETWG
jgi:hypothetical protein